MAEGTGLTSNLLQDKSLIYIDIAHISAIPHRMNGMAPDTCVAERGRRCSRKLLPLPIGFIHDQVTTGHKIRVLTVAGTYSRSVPVLDPRFSYRGEDVVAKLEWVCCQSVLNRDPRSAFKRDLFEGHGENYRLAESRKAPARSPKQTDPKGAAQRHAKGPDQAPSHDVIWRILTPAARRTMSDTPGQSAIDAPVLSRDITAALRGEPGDQ